MPMIHAPSLIESWDQCEQRAIFERVERWKPRRGGNADIGAIAGHAFAVGSAIVHDSIKSGEAGDDCVEFAMIAFESELERYLVAGIELDEAAILRARDDVRKTLPKYAKECPLRDWHTIDGIEYEMPDYGRQRLDVFGTDALGLYSVADLKFRRSLDPSRMDMALNDYRYSWQLLQYAQTLSEATGRQVERTYVILVVAAPRFKVKAQGFPVTPQLLATWRQQAEWKWADVDATMAGNRVARMAASHETRFGPCPFQRACFQYDRDRELMQYEYVKLERRER